MDIKRVSLDTPPGSDKQSPHLNVEQWIYSNTYHWNFGVRVLSGDLFICCFPYIGFIEYIEFKHCSALPENSVPMIKPVHHDVACVMLLGQRISSIKLCMCSYQKYGHASRRVVLALIKSKICSATF